LQGLSRKEAAKKLGIAEGTLSSRLAAARKKLAERLTARGVSPMAAVAVGSVSTALHAATVAAATGKVPTGARVHALVREGMAMTLLTTLKVGAALAVLVVLLAVGGRRGDETAAAAPVPRDAPDPGLIWLKHAKSGKLVGCKPGGTKVKELDAGDAYLDLRHGLIWKYDPKAGTVTGIDLDGAKVKEVASPGHFLGFSDDGKKVMFAGTDGKPRNKPADEEQPGFRGCTLHFQNVNGKGDIVATGIPLSPHGWFHWLPDGKRIIKAEPMTMKSYVLHYLFDAETKKTTSLDDRKSSPHIDLKQTLCGVSPDGQWLLTRRIFSKNLELSKVPLWGGNPELLATRRPRPGNGAAVSRRAVRRLSRSRPAGFGQSSRQRTRGSRGRRPHRGGHGDRPPRGQRLDGRVVVVAGWEVPRLPVGIGRRRQIPTVVDRVRRAREGRKDGAHARRQAPRLRR
jgi:hypothetical protein